jgi:hypothetical protein
MSGVGIAVGVSVGVGANLGVALPLVNCTITRLTTRKLSPQSRGTS